MQEEKANGNLGCIENGDRLLEFARLLYLVHEITAVHVFHHKEESIGALEAGMEPDQKGWLLRQGQDTLLDHGALGVVVLYYDVLLEDLYCEQRVGSGTLLGQHHFAEASFAENLQYREIVQSDAFLVTGVAFLQIASLTRRVVRETRRRTHRPQAQSFLHLIRDVLASRWHENVIKFSFFRCQKLEPPFLRIIVIELVTEQKTKTRKSRLADHEVQTSPI